MRWSIAAPSSLHWQVRRSPGTISPASPRDRTAASAGSEPAPTPARSGSWCSPGTLTLLLGDRRYRIETNQSAEFDTMLPHAFGAEGGPVDVLMMVDREARRSHHGDDDEAAND